jgi:DNA-binding beta-propeller fold protein YncE
VGHPQIAAFARLANGGAKAVRAIAGQNTLFTRTIHDMAYDPVRDEILVPGFYNFSVLTFRADANGDVAPVRKIMGPSTQIVNNDALAVDWIHGEIFVPVDNKVLVFPRDADGDVKPIRVLEGVRPSRVTIDPVHNLMIVSGNGGLRIFDRMANGNAKPLRFITGPGAKDVALMTMHAERGMLFGVVRPGNTGGSEGDTSGRFALEDYVGVWSVFDDGNVQPRFTIGGPNLLLKDGRGIAIDPKTKNVYVSDKTLNAVLTFNVPEAFQ